VEQHERQRRKKVRKTQHAPGSKGTNFVFGMSAPKPEKWAIARYKWT